MAKRYYWLKLYSDFFSSKRIKKLRSLAGGDTYTIIYLKMQLKSLDDEGYLYFDGVEKDFAEEIALDIDENPDDVRVTIQYLLNVGLMECSEDGRQYLLTYLENNIGSETASTQRVREFRARQKKQKALHCNADETQAKQVGNVEKEIEIEKEKIIYGDFSEADFEKLWKMYPRKKGKGQISKTCKTKIAKIGFDRMAKAIENFKRDMQGKDEQYIMYGSTFFNSGYVDYLPQEEEKHVKEEPQDNGLTEEEIDAMTDEEYAAWHKSMENGNV